MIIHVDFTNAEKIELTKAISKINKRFPMLSETEIRSVMMQFAAQHANFLTDDFYGFVEVWVEAGELN